MKALLLIFFIGASLFGREVPHLSSPVIDEAGIVNSQTEARLKTLFYKVWESKRVQFQLLTIRSLEGEILEEYSIKVADTWKLGDKETDSGLLILVAMKERKIRIEVGDGLEGSITDAFSRRVIAEITPFFKKRRYSEGIEHGAISLLKKVDFENFENEKLPSTKLKGSNDNRSRGALAILLAFLFRNPFVFFILLALIFPRSRRGGIFVGGGSSWGSSRGSSWGSSGGSSWGGGGGGFSGGGSSGSW